MKIIHLADIHLGSALTTHFDKEKSRQRNAEILSTFKKVIGYAAENGVSVVIIAGDLYDVSDVPATIKNEIYSIIREAKNITFFYLKGNHDNEDVDIRSKIVPDNLKLFKDTWTYYRLGGNIVIAGAEFVGHNDQSIYNTLSLHPDNYNIVVLHGQIDTRQLKNKYIDYAALGHIHEYSREKLDDRGVYCYCGCLESRGLDEIGEHGFVVLEIDRNMSVIKDTFVPFSGRKAYKVQVDVSGCMTTFEQEKCIREALAAKGYNRENMLKVELTGQLDVETEKNPVYLNKRFQDEYYLIKIYDLTKYGIDYKRYEHDISLKGEFIRKVMSKTDINEDEKAVIIRYGLQALRGEVIE